ncbi:hypothetical protein FZEAL_8622 [Fusarium zealandicum]|uniref:C2H2-type domain-containing protein n=1 Tax=Fusarium zealandicum TaxID=1053134 RepID=A0A8H4UE42_9HYPO|nr:hypothetical protein FZEAL_8622 [Fusarium zealandicum]
MNIYNQFNELPADQNRHPDTDSRCQPWSNSMYYPDQSSSAPRYHAYSSASANQSSISSHSAHSFGEYSELQSPDDHQHFGTPQEYSGAASASSAATTSNSPNAQDESYGWASTSESHDRNVCQCGKGFRRPSDLAKHQKYHIKYFSCLFSGCDKAFATQKDLTRHMRTHRKGEGYQCKVDGCRKAISGHVYSRKDNFDRHMRTAHPDHPHI